MVLMKEVMLPVARGPELVKSVSSDSKLRFDSAFVEQVVVLLIAESIPDSEVQITIPFRPGG